MIFDRIETDEHPLADKQCQVPVEERRVLRRGDPKPALKETANRAPRIQTESLGAAARLTHANKSLRGAKFVDFSVEPPELVQVLFTPSPELLLRRFAEAMA